jgi:hypothetical protein
MPSTFEGSSAEQTAKILDDVYDQALHLLRTTGVGGAGGAVTVADGSDVVEGALGDAAITTDVAGTVNAKLRGLIKILNDVWDSGAHQLKVSSGGGPGGGLTDAELRATPVPVSGPLTDAQLRAVAVAISAAALPLPAGASTEATLALIKAKTDNIDVALSTRAVTGLTDTQLRATPVPVSGPLTDAQLRATPVPVSGTVAVSGNVEVVNDVGNPLPVSGPLTDAQLRATAVPVTIPVPAPISDNGGSITVDGPVTDAQLRATPVPVSGPLTDAQLRAAAVPVSLATSPLSNGAATVTDERLTVTTPGTRVPFPNVACKAVAIVAELDNTDAVVVGAAASVIAALGTRRGIPLMAGDRVALPVANLNLLAIDAVVATEGVTYAVLG